MNGVIIELFRDADSQKLSCVDKIKVIFIIINSLIDGLIELNLYGSNEEKISGIIQNMGDPIIALKAISFIT